MRTNFRNLLKLTLLIGAVMCCFYSSFGQKTMNEQRVMKENHIDFTKEYIFFTIHGLIEIDGHTFKNDTCKCQIQFQANLDGIAIIDTCSKIKYEHRACGIKNCKIIHLKPEAKFEITPQWHWPSNYIYIPLNSMYLNSNDTLYARP